MIQIVGVDCATQDAKIGLARGRHDGGRTTLQDATVCGRRESAADRIAAWIIDSDAPTLLAIDAPLGWPAPLARALAGHRAGEVPDASPDDMFRRATDRFVERELGKRPLDVGADRIARTAHAALTLLGKLRRELNEAIPLAWTPEWPGRCAAIEVYPAATLTAHGLRASGYKKPDDFLARREIRLALRLAMEIVVDPTMLERNSDALDAAVCVLAGADFVGGRAMAPEDVTRAHVEGWIWTACRASGERQP